MPERAFDEEQEIRQECLGSNRTPPQRAACVSRNSTQATDKGKAIWEDDDNDGGAISNNLADVASSSSSSASSSSSSTATQEQNNSLPSSNSSQQHDEAQFYLNRGPALIASEAPWFCPEQRLFEDGPDQVDITSGLGLARSFRLMLLPEEPGHDVVPMDIIPEAFNAPEEIPVLSSAVVTLYLPGFSLGLDGRIGPFLDERYERSGIPPMDDQHQP